MLPTINFFSYSIPTMLMTFGLYLFLVGYLLVKWSQNFKPVNFKVVILYLSLHTFLGLLGAKIFYLWITHGLSSIFTLEVFNFTQGRVSYGALAGLFVAQLIFNYKLPHAFKRKNWDMSAKFLALGVGIMRLQCFFDGCCWGKISSSPLSVTVTNTSSLTPLQGVPIHPTQIYESALGFVIFFLLLRLEKEKIALMPVSLILYSLGRFFIEFFRGDDIRGVNLLWGLSTAQILSITLIASILVYCLPLKSRQNSLLRTKFIS